MELFGIELIDVEDFIELLLRFALNMGVVIVLVRYIYYRLTNRKDYLFTYLLIAVTVFLLCYLLENVKLELGFALGLFAIFGIIRYRTRQIAIKEMTYLFLVIGISVINALANKKVSYAELLFTNMAVIAATYLLEKVFFLRHETSKTIDYEKIELIKPENYQLLLEDLEERTGLIINRAEVGRLDFLRDSARVRIYYYMDENSKLYEEEEDYERSQDDDDD
jgi:uncharacterized membrane protein YoaK (UPF0700 family)